MLKEKAVHTLVAICFVLLHNFFLTCFLVIASLSCWLLFILLVLGRSRCRFFRYRLTFLFLRLTVRVTVGVTVTSPFHKAHQFLHNQECHNSSQNPQANAHIMRVAVSLWSFLMAVGVRVRMALRSWSVRRNGMRNQMEKGVAQQSARSKTQQNLEARLVARRLVQRYEK